MMFTAVVPDAPVMEIVSEMRSRLLKLMQEISRRIIQIIQSIPEGQVLSYGEVARRAGLVKGARRVSRILHSSSEKHDLPWHRVVNSRGRISLTDEAYDLQKRLLADEGVEFDRTGRIDLTRYSA